MGVSAMSCTFIANSTTGIEYPSHQYDTIPFMHPSVPQMSRPPSGRRHRTPSQRRTPLSDDVRVNLLLQCCRDLEIMADYTSKLPTTKLIVAAAPTDSLLHCDRRREIFSHFFSARPTRFLLLMHPCTSTCHILAWLKHYEVLGWV